MCRGTGLEVRAERRVSTNGTTLGVRANAGPTQVTMKKDGSCLDLCMLGAVVLWNRSYMDLLLSLGSAPEVLSALIVLDFYFLFVIIPNFRLVIAR